MYIVYMYLFICKLYCFINIQRPCHDVLSIVTDVIVMTQLALDFYSKVLPW